MTPVRNTGQPAATGAAIAQNPSGQEDPAVAAGLPVPPMDILVSATLFLDLDGTLIELADDPAKVSAGPDVRELLERLVERLDGRLALVSGRSLRQIDEILGSCAEVLAISASHGCERRWGGEHVRPLRPTSLDHIAGQFRAFAQAYPGMLVEEKTFGVALHYRMAPQAAGAARTLAEILGKQFDLFLQDGKAMVELRVAGSDKGDAIRHFMSGEGGPGTVPVFAGDDITDEAGFNAVRAMGGHGILVGEARETAATFRLPSPGALRDWLRQVVR